MGSGRWSIELIEGRMSESRRRKEADASLLARAARKYPWHLGYAVSVKLTKPPVMLTC